jgi:hypothetical protein
MKPLSLILIFSIFCLSISAQKKAKTKIKSKSTKTVAKKKVKPQRTPAETMILSMGEGEPATFGVQPMDTLVYEVDAYGSVYDFIVIVNEYSYDKGIDFNWKMTAPVNRKGHTTVTPDAMHSSKKYNNYFNDGQMTLTDATTIWLCGDNFSDMPQKSTTIQLDNDEPQTFTRPEKDEVYFDINYRGKIIKVDAFKITNDKEGEERRELDILNGSGNPLIVAMDLGWKIKLKEVR